jgi:hypothetical protein
VTFKLALHAESPSSIFYVDYGASRDDHVNNRSRADGSDSEGEDNDSSDEDSDSEEEPDDPLRRSRQKPNKLKPGAEYRRRLTDGRLFVFGLFNQKRKGWFRPQHVFRAVKLIQIVSIYRIDIFAPIESNVPKSKRITSSLFWYDAIPFNLHRKVNRTLKEPEL